MTAIAFVLTAVAAQLELTPVPQEFEFDAKKQFDLVASMPVVTADDLAPEELARIQQAMDALNVTPLMVRASEHRGRGAAIYIGQYGDNSAFENRRLQDLVWGVDKLGPQGYRLAVNDRAVVVAGVDEAGVFYGLQTLMQLASGRMGVPLGEITDQPDLALRAVHLKEQPSLALLQELAALKCNAVLIETPDLLNPNATAVARWQETAAAAKRYCIDLIPLFPVWGDMSPLLERYPELAVARSFEERVILEGDDWRTLSKPNIVVTPRTPVMVVYDGKTCRPDRDYTLDRGALAAPYPEHAEPWMIRRLVGGAIPDGAVVEVAYAYVAPYTTQCVACPDVVREAFRETIGATVERLGARYIHLGAYTPGGNSLDPRCADVPDSERFTAMAEVVRERISLFEPNIHLMIWADNLKVQGLLQPKVTADLPPATVLALRDPALVAWARGLPFPFVGAAQSNAADAYRWCTALASNEPRGAGIIVVPPEGALAGAEDVREAMEKAWSVKTPVLVWPEVLNAYFGADLWEPAPPERMEALLNRLNRQTLANVAPADERRFFEQMMRDARQRFPGKDLELDAVDKLYRNLLEYLEVEREFQEDGDSGALNRLKAVVTAQAAADPGFSGERKDVILNTIGQKGLFVPSTILFGAMVYPYRPVNVPAGHIPFEVPVTPQFEDRQHEASAVMDLLAAPGPVFRLDFDTVGTATLRLEAREDNADFESVQEWTSQQVGGVRSPILLDRPVQARYLRLTAVAPAETAVLRSPHVFAMKAPAVAVSKGGASKVVMDAVFHEPNWPKQPQMEGFIAPQARMFAGPPTSVRLMHSRDMLFVGAYAREGRIGTMVAEMQEADAPLWNEECLEVLITPPKGDEYRFIVSPKGARYDSRAGDAAWNGDWKSKAALYQIGWAAELALPFAMFDATPSAVAEWRVQCIRRRKNVQEEVSYWSVDDATRPVPGVLLFR